jgi:hypothetical protein
MLCRPIGQLIAEWHYAETLRFWIGIQNSPELQPDLSLTRSRCRVGQSKIGAPGTADKDVVTHRRANDWPQHNGGSQSLAAHGKYISMLRAYKSPLRTRGRK